MKRKDFDDICDVSPSVSPFHLPSTKARRLDCDLLRYMQEDPRFEFPEIIDEGSLLESQQACSSVVPTGVSEMNSMLYGSEEKALVLYQPPEVPTLLLTFPCPPQFPIVFDSEMIPGIKDRIFCLQNSKALQLMDDEVANRGMITNDSTAIVPWNDSQTPTNSVNQQAAESDPMDAEEVEMIDSEFTNSNISFDFNRILDDGMCVTQLQQNQ